MVSILMPCKNAALYLEECLDSILAQMHTNWELIVVNDHSDDQSPEILNNYHLKDSRIKWFNNPGSGIIAALQFAYKNAQGNFISRMDADDVMPPQKLMQMRKTFDGSQNHICTGKVAYFREGGEVGNGYQNYANWLNHLCETNSHYSQIYKECVIPSACWMVSRDTFEQIGAFSLEIYPEDYDLCFRMYQHQVPIVSLNEVLHHWRDHGARASRNDPNYSDHTFLELKMQYFLTIDFDEKRPLIIWGAGKKGKRMARYLIDRQIPFQWICENENKIGHTIYDQKLQSPALIQEVPSQLLLSIASPQDQVEIKNRLKDLSQIQSFWFC